METITNPLTQKDIQPEFAEFFNEINSKIKEKNYGYMLILVNEKERTNRYSAEEIATMIDKLRAETLLKVLSTVIRDNIGFWSKLKFFWKTL